MLRHAETPKGPRRVPTVACDGSKNGHLTAPRVGYFFLGALRAQTAPQLGDVMTFTPFRSPLGAQAGLAA